MHIQEKISWKWQGGEKKKTNLYWHYFDINNTILWFHHLQALQTIHDYHSNHWQQQATYHLWPQNSVAVRNKLTENVLTVHYNRDETIKSWFHQVIKFLVSSCDRPWFMFLQKSNAHKTFITDHIHRYRTLEKDARWQHKRIMTETNAAFCLWSLVRFVLLRWACWSKATDHSHQYSEHCAERTFSR